MPILELAARAADAAIPTLFGLHSTVERLLVAEWPIAAWADE
jgi:hypothetical protein